MRRRLRLTVCLATAAATAGLGALLAPAAHADPERQSLLPPQPGANHSPAPGMVPDVPPFGRKWG